MSYARPPALWDINQDAWRLYTDVETQWRGSGMGLIGLDYAEVRQSAAELEIPWSRRNKNKIKAIEKAVLKHVNSSSDK